MWSFVAISIVIIVVPGVDMVLLLQQTIAYGRRAALITAAGIVSGGFVHSAGAALGVSTLVATSATAYSVLKTVGAAYLVWLGVSALLAAHKRSASRPGADVALNRARTPSLSRSYLTGFLSNILNPKVALFFLLFLPQFVPPGPGALVRTLALAATFIAIAAVWLLMFVLLLDKAKVLLEQPTVRRVVEQVSGVVLVALAVRLVVGESPAAAA